MIIFITGGAKNGKSSLAQDLTVQLAGSGKRYYIATMIPADEEDRERICKHIADRDGLGFITLEQGRNLTQCLQNADRSGAFLLDSATALLLNELFPDPVTWAPDFSAGQRCAKDIAALASQVRHLVVVSDYIYGDGKHYDEVTEGYRQGLALIDRTVAGLADTVIEMVSGNLILHKGELPK